MRQLLASLALLALVASLAFSADPDWPKLEEEAKGYLRDLIQINTMNPPGNEEEAARYISEVLSRENIESQIFVSTPGRANIIARLKGNGSKKPLLLLGHLDTVGVQRERWKVDPLSAREEGGHLYGRGTLDMKGLVALNLAIFTALKRQETPSSRDIIFLAVADEESGGQLGLKWLIANHWAHIAAEYALNEGGFARSKNNQTTLYGIQCAEKLYYDIKMTARGRSGHSSVPHGENPLLILSQTITRLTTRVVMPQLNSVTQAYFEGIKEDPQKFPLGTREYAMARNTIAPTVIMGGFRNNVIPGEAWVNLNARLLPESQIKDFVEELKRAAGDPRITFEFNEEPAMPKAPISPMDSEFFRVLKAAGESVFPGAKVVAYMSTGASDSADLRAKGVSAYGMAIPITQEDERGIHGDDERVSIAAFNKTLRFLWESVSQISK